MKVKVLFFGATADAAGGSRAAELDLPEGTRSAEALAMVVAEYAGLGQHRLLYSVNEEYAAGTELLKEGDEIAVFTPVSGG
jgi:molybdopterin converting factor small subunit